MTSFAQWGGVILVVVIYVVLSTWFEGTKAYEWLEKLWERNMFFIGFIGLFFWAWGEGWVQKGGMVTFGVAVLNLLGQIIARMRHREAMEKWEKEEDGK